MESQKKSDKLLLERVLMFYYWNRKQISFCLKKIEIAIKTDKLLLTRLKRVLKAKNPNKITDIFVEKGSFKLIKSHRKSKNRKFV